MKGPKGPDISGERDYVRSYVLYVHTVHVHIEYVGTIRMYSKYEDTAVRVQYVHVVLHSQESSPKL